MSRWRPILYWVGGTARRRWRAVQAWRRGGGARTISTRTVIQPDCYDPDRALLADRRSTQLFWVHMVQHILLLAVAPPLILMARPWPRLWRAIPRRIRIPLGRKLASGNATKPLRWLAHPLPAWTLFNVDMVVWHLPKFYNFTLGHQWVHDCEHTLFFFTGMLFWAHIVDPGPIRARLTWPLRTAYVIGAMVVGWMLAIAFVLYPTPLYPHYADLLHRPGGLSAIDDQQVAGGMMWVFGSISYTVTAIYAFWRWVEPDRLASGRGASVAT